jgi:hypothetical protein
VSLSALTSHSDARLIGIEVEMLSFPSLQPIVISRNASFIEGSVFVETKIGSIFIEVRRLLFEILKVNRRGIIKGVAESLWRSGCTMRVRLHVFG